LIILIGLTAITTGLGGILANMMYGKGFIALLGLGISLTTMMLGLILLYMGLSNKWSY
jgi:hypothetical protein